MIIGICDDEKIIHELMEKHLRKYCNKVNINHKIINFYSGEELLNCNKELDVIFLDIEMSGINGMETARKLRNRGCNTMIIFLTNYQEFLVEGYEVQAFRYLLKSNIDLKLENYIDDVERRIMGDKIVTLNKKIKLKAKLITYISSRNGRSDIWTEKNSYGSSYSLEYWEKELNSNLFFRCHKKYIVNISYIVDIKDSYIESAISKQYVHMKNGDKIEVSKRKYATLKKLLIEYDLS